MSVIKFLIYRWRGTAKINRGMDGLKRKFDRVMAEKAEADRKLRLRQDDLDTLEAWYKKEVERTREALDVARLTNTKMAEALDAANEYIKTLEEVTIPGLVAANSTFVARWEAETAVQTMRKVHHTATTAVRDE